ncbi:DUF3577 domain-containing protein [Chitinimonas koreensis]|uniref:DUF3577 domain-containing protein n=1 Tax=Chitinimonas koreensis TaxID=356302 RepID=UPI00048A5172|nr:DUF3577 domain-containing protein [Chitinimonas koreensis]QNM95509.1 DUF3577 domain-containing protein [Chitinimonas koreensis]
MQQSQNDQTHFDLHAVVCGYLSRVRWVKPKRGDRFLACAILAFRPDGDKLSYTYIDLKVVGADAVQLIAGFEKDVSEGNKKVFVQLRIGDLFVHKYDATDKSGNTEERLCLKARALKVLAHEVHDSLQTDELREKYDVNMLVRGLGYLNRVTDLNREGNKIQVSSISALCGRIDEEERQYVAFDLINADCVASQIGQLRPAVSANKGVMVGFEISNVYPGSFVYTRGQHAGETGLVIKGQLCKISWAKVDSVRVELEQPEMSKANAA